MFVLAGARVATLIGLQRVTIAIGAAVRIACLNRRTALKQKDRLGGAAIVAQLAKLGFDVVHIAGAVEVAGVVAAQVVTVGGYGAPVAVSTWSAFRDNAVLDRSRAVGPDAAAVCRAVPAERAVVDRQSIPVADAAAPLGCTIPAERAVVDRRQAAVGAKNADAAALKGGIRGDGAAVDRQRAAALINAAAAVGCTIPANGAVVDRQRAGIPDAAAAEGGTIRADGAVVDRQRAGIPDAAAIAVSDRQFWERHSPVGNRDYRASLVAVNNRRCRTGAYDLQADFNGEILGVDRWGHHDGVTRRTQRDGMPNGLAGGLGRLAVVVVVAVHAIHIPRVAGQSGWG